MIPAGLPLIRLGVLEPPFDFHFTSGNDGPRLRAVLAHHAFAGGVRLHGAPPYGSDAWETLWVWAWEFIGLMDAERRAPRPALQWELAV